MYVVICNRCKKQFEPHEKHLVIENHPVKRDGTPTVLLCQSCVEDFTIWLEEGVVDMEQNWQLQYEDLATKIREEADLETMIKIVGPTKQELKGALERIELADNLFVKCNWPIREADCTPEAKSARQQYSWLMDAQARFEKRYY